MENERNRDLMIEASAVTHRFKQLHALDNMNLKVEKGSVYALLGVNGSGKTTFVRLLTGQTGLQKGNIRIFGQELKSGAWEGINRAIGYVPENKNMYTYMTGRQMLEFTASFYKNCGQSEHKFGVGKAAARCLELFELPMDRKIREFSKGMRSQLALALALCGDPELLILDEPTDGLDPVKRNQFYRFLLDLVGEGGKTVFMTTNSIADVEKIADHMGIIRDGRLQVDGETGGIIENSKKVRIAFGGEVIPDFTGWKGISKVIRENRSVLVHINENAEEVIEKLRELPSAFMDVIPMNLEDIFLEVNGGKG